MIEKIGERVSVNSTYNHVTGEVMPKRLIWKNKLYDIQKVGLHYTLYRGSTLIHMFSACNNQHFFLLSLDTQTLHWTLEEIADDNSN